MQENKLFPGRPGYTGPTSGVFAMLHHTVLAEHSHDVMERVDYVRAHKPKREIEVRLHNMMYLGDAGERYLAKFAPLDADYAAKRGALWADYAAKRAPLWAAYEAKCAPLEADYAAKRAPLEADYEAKIGALWADYAAKRAPLEADYAAKIGALWADYEAKIGALWAELLAHIAEHMPDHAWDGHKIKGTEG